MQQRVSENQGAKRARSAFRPAVGLALVSLVSLTLLSPLSSAAQEKPAGSTAGESHVADLPVMLFVPKKAGNAASAPDDLGMAVLVELRETVAASGHYQTITYSPNHPLIKRALTEHVLATPDLVEPIGPATMQLIARILGARDVLTLSATKESTGLKSDFRLEHSEGPQTWRTVLVDQFQIPLTLGKRKLKPAELVDLSVDHISSSIGIPSHRAAKLQLAPGPRVSGKKAPKRDNAAPAADATGTAASAAQPSPPDSTPPDAQAGSAAAATGGAGTPPTNQIPVSNQSTQHSSRTAKTTAHDPLQDMRAVTGDAAGAFTTDNSPGRHSDTGPVAADAPIPAPPARADSEAQALHFQQTGDLANTIVSLRHAIDQRPRDVTLRRQLIQAYQARGMGEEAQDEAARSLQLSPNDAVVHRLYGEVLTARGDIPAALAAFRDAIRLDPSDITSQLALGDGLLANSQYGEALDAYTQAAKSDPKSPLPHRRLARALAGRAASDPHQYEASLNHIQQARSLTLPADTQSYVEDYVALMRLMSSRLRDMLEELQAGYADAAGGKRQSNELLRLTADIKDRAEAAADYLDKVPPAAGQDVTQAHYQQASGLLLQTVTLMHDYLMGPDNAREGALKGSLVDTSKEIGAADKRLQTASRPADSRVDQDDAGAGSDRH